MNFWSPVTFFQRIRPHIFPYVAACCFVVTCSITLTMAYSSGHVSGFVLISDTGTKPPESCVFGLLLTLYALMIGFSVWNVYTTTPNPTAIHGWACFVGFLSALGVIIVANFQETIVLAVHIFGAIVAFGLATLYVWLTLASSSYMRLFRMWLAAQITICLVCTSVTGLTSVLKFSGSDRLQWKPADGGYELHVASVFSEWFLAIGLNTFIVTLSRDIRLGYERLSRRQARASRDSRTSATLHAKMGASLGAQRGPETRTDQSSKDAPTVGTSNSSRKTASTATHDE